MGYFLVVLAVGVVLGGVAFWYAPRKWPWLVRFVFGSGALAVTLMMGALLA